MTAWVKLDEGSFKLSPREDGSGPNLAGNAYRISAALKASCTGDDTLASAERSRSLL